MQKIINFLGDPLVVPVYWFMLGYLAVWLLAFGLARAFSNAGEVGSYIRGSNKAWRFALLGHILSGTALVAWLSFKAVNMLPTWWQIPLYMIPYLFFLTLDVFLMLSFRQSRATV